MSVDDSRSGVSCFRNFLCSLQPRARNRFFVSFEILYCCPALKVKVNLSLLRLFYMHRFK